MVVDACLGGVRRTVPAGATLDLNFMSAPLDPRITFTRASTATYTDQNGTIRTATANAPRWDYDPVTHALRGVLIEEARTNLCLQSNGGAGPWVAYGNVVAAPVVTANATTAPDGTLTGTALAYPAVSGASAISVIYQPITVTAAVHTFSVYLKGAVGGEQVYFNVDLIGGSFASTPRLTLTTQWQRFVLVTPTLTAAAWTVEIGTDLRDGSATGTPAQTIYAWGAQLELGGFVTTPIATVLAAVTRAQDICYIPTNVSWYSGAAFSFNVEFDGPPSPWSGGFIGLSDGTFGNSLYAGPDAGVNIGTSFIPTSVSTPQQIISRTGVNKFVTTFTTTRLSISSNGAAVGAVAQSASPFTVATRLVMGNDPWFMSTAFNGHVRRVQYWPRALSDTEMRQVTT